MAESARVLVPGFYKGPVSRCTGFYVGFAVASAPGYIVFEYTDPQGFGNIHIVAAGDPTPPRVAQLLAKYKFRRSEKPKPRRIVREILEDGTGFDGDDDVYAFVLEEDAPFSLIAAILQEAGEPLKHIAFFPEGEKNPHYHLFETPPPSPVDKEEDELSEATLRAAEAVGRAAAIKACAMEPPAKKQRKEV